MRLIHRGVGLAALAAAAGWVALAASQAAAAVQLGQVPGKAARALTVQVPVVVAGASATGPVYASGLIEQYRPRPSWASVVGRVSLACGETVCRLARRAYFYHTGGIYGP